MPKIIEGKAVSTKTPKTVTVAVDSRRSHPLYGKIVRHSKKYKVHNENFEVRIGDRLKIQETRPVSRSKHFKVIEILGKK